MRGIVRLFVGACFGACVPLDDLDEYSRNWVAHELSEDAGVDVEIAPLEPDVVVTGDAGTGVVPLVPVARADDMNEGDGRDEDAGLPGVADVFVPPSEDAGGAVVVDAQAATCASEELLGPDGRCYFFQPDELTWSAARAACQARGTGWDLASVRSAAESAFLAEELEFEAWLGASDEDVEETWVWVADGTPFWSGSGTDGSAIGGEYTTWNSDEPNGGLATNCMRVVPELASPDAGAPWADLVCEQELGAVCELYAP